MNRFRTTALALVGVVAIGALAQAQQVPGAGSTINAVFNMIYDASTMKPSYRATGKIATVASATDVCALQGSATKMVKLRRVQLSTVATTAIAEPVAFIKRSTAASAGGGVQQTVVPMDSINVLTNGTNSGTATLETWTANPTVGTTVGALADPTLLWSNATTIQPYTEFTFGQLASPVVLRGVAESLTLNLNGVTIAGGNLTCTFEWTEE